VRGQVFSESITYNGVKSEKHALFQDPVSGLELKPLLCPSKAFKAAELRSAPNWVFKDLQRSERF
jgi:hypothetical protein